MTGLEQAANLGTCARACSESAVRSEPNPLGSVGVLHRTMGSLCLAAGSEPLFRSPSFPSAAPAKRFEYEGVKYDRPRFDIPQVKRAGESLRKYEASDHDLEIIGNWRSSHALPLLTFRVTLSNWGRELQDDVLISQRLKRLPSIAAKLRRIRRLRLSTIQDIGGCRAVLSSEKRARNLYDRYLDGGLTHALVRQQNYVDEPKLSGYRGFHLIYAYQGRESTVVYSGLLIEIQIRSAQQHAWATAVETVDIFTRQALKSSMGNPDWDEFFKLMASYIALRERTPTVPATPDEKPQLKARIRECEARIGAMQRLHDFRQITTEFDTELVHQITSERFPQYFLLEVRPSDFKIIIRAYKNAALKLAEEKYLDTERRILDEGGKSDAVLVSVAKLNNLRRAYPSYYGDTELFLQILGEAIA